MPLREAGVNCPDLIGGLAYDLEIANDRVLNERRFEKRGTVEPFDIRFDARDRDNNMLDVVVDPRRFLFHHTGFASATILLRNLIDKSCGVFTSTLVCVRSSIAMAIAAISNRLKPSAASINKSRSLFSVSSSRRTEPKTRGFNPRC